MYRLTMIPLFAVHCCDRAAQAKWNSKEETGFFIGVR
jgi:hypothetical protein